MGEILSQYISVFLYISLYISLCKIIMMDTLNILKFCSLYLNKAEKRNKYIYLLYVAKHLQQT